MTRFGMIEFEHAQAAAEVVYPGHQSPVETGFRLTRDDMDVVLGALAVSGTVLLAAHQKTGDTAAASALAGIVGCAVPAAYYCVRLLNKLAPAMARSTAQSILEFRVALVADGRLERSTTASALPDMAVDGRPPGESAFDHEHAWRMGLLRFMLVGKLNGMRWSNSVLSEDRIDERGHAIPKAMTDTAQRLYSEVMRDNGYMRVTASGLALAPGYDYRAVCVKLRHEALKLPEKKWPPEIRV